MSESVNEQQESGDPQEAEEVVQTVPQPVDAAPKPAQQVVPNPEDGLNKDADSDFSEDRAVDGGRVDGTETVDESGSDLGR